MPFSDPEKARIYYREREKQRRKDPEYSKKLQQRFKRWYNKKTDTVVAHDIVSVGHKRDIRKKLILGYGSKCSRCGESESSFLSLDHIEGGGTKEFKLKGNYKVYNELINSGFPSEYRLLCHNCNWIAYMERSGIQRRTIVIEVLSKYGGRCVCCGVNNLDILTLDHVNGGGKQHQREVGGGTGMYRWARKNNFPSVLQILCWNCNSGRRNCECPHRKRVA